MANVFERLQWFRAFRAAPWALLLFLVARTASAQDDQSWRHGGSRRESPQWFAFEVRFGRYQPKIDEQVSGKPFETTFGDDNRYFGGLEFDWQMLRVPWLGSIGPGFGWAYTHASAKGKLLNNADAGEDTFLSIMPMYLVGVARIDVLARETVIPVVGYAKAGLGYGLYWSGNDRGTQVRGGSWGTHFALGGMLLLDAFDPHAAVQMDNNWGINHTYLFAEWMLANLDGFGKSDKLNVGTNTWVLGLALEM